MVARLVGAGGVVALGLPLVVLAAAFHAAAARGAAAPAAPRLLIVADERPAMDVLAAFLRDEGRYEVQCVDQKALPERLTDYYGVFQYVHGRMTDRTERALVEYTLGGGRLVCLHHGIASGRVNNPSLLRMTGIHIAPRNDPNHPWRVINAATCTLVNLHLRHYITTHNVRWERMAEYVSSDSPTRPVDLPVLDLAKTEVFLNQHFTDGREKTVLLGFRCQDPATGKTHMQDRAGWYKPAGKGWVFYLQPGHAVSDFQNRSYCQIIWNCLTWRPDMPPADEPARAEKPAASASTPAGPQTDAKRER